MTTAKRKIRIRCWFRRKHTVMIVVAAGSNSKLMFLDLNTYLFQIQLD